MGNLKPSVPEPKLSGFFSLSMTVFTTSGSVEIGSVPGSMWPASGFWSSWRASERASPLILKLPKCSTALVVGSPLPPPTSWSSTSAARKNLTNKSSGQILMNTSSSVTFWSNFSRSAATSESSGTGVRSAFSTGRIGSSTSLMVLSTGWRNRLMNVPRSNCTSLNWTMGTVPKLLRLKLDASRLVLGMPQSTTRFAPSAGNAAFPPASSDSIRSRCSSPLMAASFRSWGIVVNWLK